jgi:hypothetical protein
LRGGDCRETFILGLLAGLASLGLVLQALVMKEDLFAASPDEVVAAIDALDCSILELHLSMTPLPIRCACDLSFCHDYKSPVFSRVGLRAGTIPAQRVSNCYLQADEEAAIFNCFDELLCE